MMRLVVVVLLSLATIGSSAADLQWTFSCASLSESRNELKRAFEGGLGFDTVLANSGSSTRSRDSVYTYRAVVSKVGRNRDETYLGLGILSAPAMIYWNGVRVFRWGMGSPEYASTSYQGEVVSLPPLPPLGGDQDVLVIQMFPHGNGSGLPQVQIGEYSEQGEFAFKRGFLNLVVPGAGALASLMVCFLALALWYALGRSREDWMWFAHASFGVAISFAPRAFSSPMFPDHMLLIVGRSGMILASVSFNALMMMHMGFDSLVKRLRYWLLGGYGAVFLMLALSPDANSTERVFAWCLNLYVMPMLVVCAGFVVWICLRRRAVKDFVLASGFVFLFGACLHDFYHYTRGTSPIAWFFPTGYLCMEMAMFCIIAIELLALWRQNQHRAAELVVRSEELTQERIKSDKALRARALFLDKMAHEFRTPMQGLMGMVDLLKSGGQNVDRTILGGTERLLKRHLVRINNVVDQMDLRQGTLQLRRERFDPEFLASGWRHFFAPRDDTSTSFPVGDPVYAMGDPERIDRVVVSIGQILSEGLDDVVDVRSAYEDGLMDVRLVRKHSRAKHLEERLFGEAMARNEYLADGSELVAALGGRLDVHHDGDELVCRISLPLEPAERSSSFPFGETLERESPLVLLAEDERINAKLVATLLERAGCEVRWARDGQEAVDFAQMERPDLILMDVNMPVMDGLEAARILRADPVTSRIPIVAVSAHANENLVLGQGIDGFVSKPIRASQLRELVNRYCRNRG